MNGSKKHSGIAVALAWPQTYCKQPGAWYDPITLLLGINKNNYYKVGHAALLLIDTKIPKVHYFDFGRYHSPYKHGRVRSAETDLDLEITTIPKMSSKHLKINNLRNILLELQSNPACHGEGVLHAALCPINFEKAFAKALEMQKASPIPYGPFTRKGSNCSRFVNTVIFSGNPCFKFRFRLKYKIPLTPTPLNNVNALENKMILPKLLEGEPFCPIKRLNKQVLTNTLPSPERHFNIPENAQWLSGEGAGSWFAFEIDDTVLRVTRYSPQGVVECSGLYENKNAVELMKGARSFSIAYPSNCKEVFLKVKENEIRFQRAI